MIDLTGWSSSARLILLIVPFMLMIVGTALNAYIAGSRHFCVMCHAFRRSRGLYDEILLWGTTSQKSRMVIVSAMTLGLIWPSIGHRQGWLSVDDSKEFPDYLSRILKASSYCLILGIVMLVLVISFTKITKS